MHQNHRGDVVGVTDIGGNVVYRFEYSTYGEIFKVNSSNELDEFTDFEELVYGFQGRRLDSETNGLMYFRNRYYNPELGRFISRDPLNYSGGSMGLYEAFGGNSYKYIDPFGTNYKTVDKNNNFINFFIDLAKSFGLPTGFIEQLNNEKPITFIWKVEDGAYYKDQKVFMNTAWIKPTGQTSSMPTPGMTVYFDHYEYESFFNSDPNRIEAIGKIYHELFHAYVDLVDDMGLQDIANQIIPKVIKSDLGSSTISRGDKALGVLEEVLGMTIERRVQRLIIFGPMYEKLNEKQRKNLYARRGAAFGNRQTGLYHHVYGSFFTENIFYGMTLDARLECILDKLFQGAWFKFLSPETQKGIEDLRKNSK